MLFVFELCLFLSNLRARATWRVETSNCLKSSQIVWIFATCKSTFEVKSYILKEGKNYHLVVSNICNIAKCTVISFPVDRCRSRVTRRTWSLKHCDHMSDFLDYNHLFACSTTLIMIITRRTWSQKHCGQRSYMFFFLFEIIFSTVTVQTLLDGAPTARLHPHL